MLIFTDYYILKLLTSKGHKYEKIALFGDWCIKCGFLCKR